MSIIQDCKDIFKPIYCYYHKFIEDISFFDFDHIYYTDNIKEDIYMFCNPEEYEEYESYGVVIAPNEIVEDIVVLIDVSENNIISFAECLIHELVHVVDFHNFSEYYLNGNTGLINSHKLKNDYALWSEFRAFSIAQIKCYEYIDYICHTSSTKNMIELYRKNIVDFLKRQHLCVLNESFSEYDLSKTLGSIYLLDNFYNINDISQSYIYEYLPILFKSNLLYFIYDLYYLLFDSDKNHKIFDNLSQIAEIRNKVLQSQ